MLVFDHFQEVRQVLGNTRDAEADGAVTAIDVSPGSDFLICGYQSGRLVLWDIMQVYTPSPFTPHPHPHPHPHP